jgi:hypothetical protein
LKQVGTTRHQSEALSFEEKRPLVHRAELGGKAVRPLRQYDRRARWKRAIPGITSAPEGTRARWKRAIPGITSAPFTGLGLSIGVKEHGYYANSSWAGGNARIHRLKESRAIHTSSGDTGESYSGRRCRRGFAQFDAWYREH